MNEELLEDLLADDDDIDWSYFEDDELYEDHYE